MTKIHILGICGTFMAGIASIAKAMGYEVSGSDQGVYPPMSTYLESLGIEIQAFPDVKLEANTQYITGNVMRRGMSLVEEMLTQKRPLVSGPQWLYEHVLQHKKVLCVAGTHGKTTTASMLAWILESAGLNPGFLIGGLPGNFEVSARAADSDYFVIEGDEYDTAFFDKRSKFIHYRPDVLVINNLEFDHADLFDDLKMIQTQFHHLLKLTPKNGAVIHPQGVTAIDEVIERGIFAPQVTTSSNSADWSAKPLSEDGSEFEVRYRGQKVGSISWGMLGEHNINNALSAIAAASQVGIDAAIACDALSVFKGVKRRLECVFDQQGIKIYDDFAHHPSAIKSTLESMKAHVEEGRVIAVLEPRSNTMKQGYHQETLVDALQAADMIYCYQPPGLGWDMPAAFSHSETPVEITSTVDILLEVLTGNTQSGDHIVVMSNGGFEGLHQRLSDHLSTSPV